jgi:thiosulfate/3-mercaptopyruvate sulfurtransferase
MAETLGSEFAVRNRWLVTAEWLQAHLDHPQVLVVDCRFALADPTAGQRAYSSDHIPGAHYLDLNRDLSGPVERHGGRHPLPQPEQLAAKLSALGVRSASESGEAADGTTAPTLVVAYDDARFAFAARLWWLLRYYGHDSVVVLDGGYGAWQAADYPVTAVVPDVAAPAQRQQFVPRLRPDWIVDIAALQQALPTASSLPAGQVSAAMPFALIDSREAERYRGEREPIDPIAGHIPGALNYPWAEVTDGAGFAQPSAAQHQRWSQLPDSPGEPLDAAPVVYCGSGVTACVNLLSLAMIGKFARLYPGSWSDWCSYRV